MSFQQGLSGLSSAGKSLDVTGANIANASTVGFKGARTQFADLYGKSMVAGSGTAIGIGVAVAGVAQQFTQGNITVTSNVLDVAINGNGFFQVGHDGVNSYTRNGIFHLDKDGNIVNDGSEQLRGVIANPDGTVPSISANSVGPINVSSSVGTPNASTAITLKANLNGEASIPSSATFSTSDASSYNDSRSMDVYDSQGGQHSLAFYYVKTAANTWNVYTTLTDVSPTGVESTLPTTGTNKLTTLTFDTGGVLSSPTTPPSLTYTNLGSGSVDNLTMTVDFTGLTQFKSDFAVEEMNQDGYAKGKLSGLSIGPDGLIQARYDNGKSSTIAQIALYTFANPNGLLPQGNNLWVATTTSGDPVANFPGKGNTGVIQSSAIEESNVDLTQELVNLIIQQRNYQASAQTVKAQDQAMQTVVNLR